jgi:hypothetical protein
MVRRARPIAVLAALAVALVLLSLRPAGAPAIVGGQPADPAQWPFAVALLHANEPNAFQAQFCAGTLVRSDWLVTAAHCVEDVTTGIEAVTGMTDLETVTPADRIPVDIVAIYPLRSAAGAPGDPHDLAVLHLAHPASAGTPARLPAAQTAEDLLPPRGWVAGWGALDGSGTTFAARLLTGEVSIFRPSACREVGAPPGTVCASFPDSLEASACFGDSGGPLAAVRDSRLEVVGIVSYGPALCGEGNLTVYTDVAAYKPWIGYVSRGSDPAVSLPHIQHVKAQDRGQAIRLNVDWCQSRGRGHEIIAEFTLARRTQRVGTFKVRGRATGACMEASRTLPDRFRNGAYRVVAKVVDRTTGMSFRSRPVALTVR